MWKAVLGEKGTDFNHSGVECKRGPDDLPDLQKFGHSTYGYRFVNTFVTLPPRIFDHSLSFFLNINMVRDVAN